jgi:hypothetical protein
LEQSYPIWWTPFSMSLLHHLHLLLLSRQKRQPQRCHQPCHLVVGHPPDLRLVFVNDILYYANEYDMSVRVSYIKVSLGGSYSCCVCCHGSSSLSYSSYCLGILAGKTSGLSDLLVSIGCF